MEGDKQKKPESLMDLMGQLQKDIQGSDWLQKNTAENWSKENPELSEQYLSALKKSNQDSKAPAECDSKSETTESMK